jgi:hypothetical protein
VGDPEANSKRTVDVDYRTLFLGACALISILGGGYWVLYTTQQSIINADMDKTNTFQWNRIQIINDFVLSHTAHIELLEKAHDDIESRLRKLESSIAVLEARGK